VTDLVRVGTLRDGDGFAHHLLRDPKAAVGVSKAGSLRSLSAKPIGVSKAGSLRSLSAKPIGVSKGRPR
jgi:hypothetical protein